MEFLEKDLEQIIYESDKKLLSEKGLYMSGKLIRQQKIGNYGIADLIEYHRPLRNPYSLEMVKGFIKVYELKKGNISIETFLQALRYLKGIKSFLSKRGIEDNYNYGITLIGRNVDLQNPYCYLAEFISDFDFDTNINHVCCFSLKNYIYSYGINGIQFIESTNYALINEGF